MSAGARRAALVTAVAFSVLAGCAGRRLHDGVYRSEHGFRVTVPGPAWKVVDRSQAELELRRTDGGAGMLAHASFAAPMVQCDALQLPVPAGAARAAAR